MSALEDTMAGGAPYHLSVDSFPPDLLRVQALAGREALSESWSFDVTVTSESTDEGGLETRLLRRRAALVWNLAGSRRAFHGVIAAVRLVEVGDGHGGRRYQLHFVPRLWLLKKRRRSRIFQGESVPTVVTAVLRESGIDARFRLLRDHPAREYCTQYEESDHRFVTRLLAEEGIWFTFASGAEISPGDGALVPGDTLLLGDGALYPPLGGDDAAVVAASTASAARLYVLAQGLSTVSQLDKVFRFEPESTVRSNVAAFRDYDPERPMARLGAQATSNHPFPEPSAKDDVAADLEVYEHHGPYPFPSWSFATEEPHLMLRQKRRRAATAVGESGCPDLAPGHRFALCDHPAPHVDREYVLVEVTHRGKARAGAGERDRIYENSFEVVPAEVVYPPRRPRRKSTQVSLTATVVGPRGEEIHTDGFGQIRVQFHWDREGKNDQHSSCWIRTMHPWAGAGWGAQFIPRVGMEVVVVFDGGDPDKPMVIGCLYNGTHPPPFRLPGQKTRSGFRSQTTPASGGHNELSFEDAAHHEQIYLRAERDLDEVVMRDHTLAVHASERIEVTGARHDIVRGGLRSDIGGGVEQAITGPHHLTLEGNRVDAVSGDRDDRVRGAFQTRIEGRERRDVKGPAELAYEDDHTL
ncbi:MAG: type VI secretion system tip protein TssI/VgrG, partial [Minicystis sp.]